MKKRILITGKGSYVGTNFIKWLEKWPGKYDVNAISVRGEEWKNHNFSQYDVVLHVAGIAHVSADPNLEEMYYSVNRDLAISVAKKARVEGVPQFIFTSSIIVYGDSSSEQRVIKEDTIPTPSNFYGDSKLQAEKGIISLESDDFKVVILRPPMIYGKDSKGNYPKLSKLARVTPIFPKIDNQRSMLHIDNLCEFIRLTINNEESGLFFPQNDEYINTSKLVKTIADVHGKKMLLTKLFNPILRMIGVKLGIVNKVFGNLVYDQSLSRYKQDYRVRTFKESIEVTENR